MPTAILREIEDLVVLWGSHGIGGIAAHAYTLPSDEREREAGSIREMLQVAEAAATSAPPGPIFRTE